MTRPHFPPHTSLTQTHISSTRSVDSPLSTENGQSILFSGIHSLLLLSQQKLDNPEAPQQSKPGPAPAGDPLGIARTTPQVLRHTPSDPLHRTQQPSSSISSGSRVGADDASSVYSSRHSAAMSDAGAGIGCPCFKTSSLIMLMKVNTTSMRTERIVIMSPCPNLSAGVHLSKKRSTASCTSNPNPYAFQSGYLFHVGSPPTEIVRLCGQRGWGWCFVL